MPRLPIQPVDDWLSENARCDTCGTPAHDWAIVACTGRAHFVLEGPGYTPPDHAQTPFRVPAVIAEQIREKNERIAAIEANQEKRRRAGELLFAMPKQEPK